MSGSASRSAYESNTRGIPCFFAYVSARLRSRAATETSSKSADVRAGFTTAWCVMRAAPRTPRRTGLMGGHCRCGPSSGPRPRSGRLRLRVGHVAQEAQQERALEVAHVDELEPGARRAVLVPGVLHLALELDAGAPAGAQ